MVKQREKPHISSRISPHEYLVWASKTQGPESVTHPDFLSNPPPPKSVRPYVPIVTDSVHLALSPLGRSIKNLPPAIIEGSLTADDTCSLETVTCSSTEKSDLDGSPVSRICPTTPMKGELTARLCQSLKLVTGHFEKNVDLSWSSLEKLETSFSCAASVDLEYCKFLSDVDCLIEGSVNLEASSVKSFGPNFSVHGSLHVCKCKNLLEIGFAGDPSSVFVKESALRRITEKLECKGPVKITECQDLAEISGSAVSWEISDCSVESIKNLSCKKSISVVSCPKLKTASVHSAQSASFRLCPSLSEIVHPKKGMRLMELSECKSIEKLSGTFTGDLHLLSMEGLRSLGPALSVSSDMMVLSCQNLSLIEAEIGRDLHVGGLSSLNSLGQALIIKGNLTIMRQACSKPSPDPMRMEISCPVRGNVNISGGLTIETSASFRVGGTTTINNCHYVSAVRGTIEKDLIVVKSGLGHLGADLDIGGNLTIKDSSGDFVINCHVEGTCEIHASFMKKMGPAFTSASAPLITSPRKRSLRKPCKKTIRRPIKAKKFKSSV